MLITGLVSMIGKPVGVSIIHCHRLGVLVYIARSLDAISDAICGIGPGEVTMLDNARPNFSENARNEFQKMRTA